MWRRDSVDGTGRITRFTYDLRRRKLTETNGANDTVRYAYDPVGNLKLQAHPLYTAALPNPNGNIRRQSSATAQTEYRYDALDRLIEITPPTGPPASYRYGPSDVRIASLRAGEETRFHYDGERLILETNPLGNPQKHYAYTAAGLLNTALLGSTPQHRSAHLDAQTSPIAISAANGNLPSRSHFDPFGVETPLLGNRDHRITHQGYWTEPPIELAGAQLSAARSLPETRTVGWIQMAASG